MAYTSTVRSAVSFQDIPDTRAAQFAPSRARSSGELIEAGDRTGECVTVTKGHDDAGFALVHEIRRAPCGRGNHWQPLAHRFEDDQAEPFIRRREYQQVVASVLLDHLFLGDAIDNSHVWTRRLAEGGHHDRRRHAGAENRQRDRLAGFCEAAERRGEISDPLRQVPRTAEQRPGPRGAAVGWSREIDRRLRVR